MPATKSRVCRDCGTALGLILEHQCPGCRARTAWRPLQGWPDPIVIEVPAKAPPPSPHPSAAKPPPCRPGKHPSCKHYRHLISQLIEMNAGCGMCLVCAAMDEDDGTPFSHKADCLLAPLEPPQGDGTDD
jgi:hypothetical protein